MSDAMNGAASALKAAEAAVRVNPNVVKLLEDALTQARAGAVTNAAVAAVGPQGQIVTLFAGDRQGDMHTAVSMLKVMILGNIMNPRNQSPIVRPAHS